MISTRALSVALFAVVALGPLAARAEPTETQKREAKELNEKATRLYEVGKYGEAIEAYQEVYLRVEDPVLLYNIAQSYRLWGKPEDSIRFYRNYLRRSPNAPNRADVEKKIADQERLVEERKRSPVTAPPPVTNPPAEVTAPPPPPPPTQTVPSTTPPPVEPSAMMPQAPAPTPPPESHRGRKVTSYVLLAVGGAFLATSVITGAIAHQKGKDLENMSKNGMDQAFDPKIQKDGKNANSVAIATGVIGAAAAITGGILLLTTPSEERVALFPMVGPQLAGGGARVKF